MISIIFSYQTYALGLTKYGKFKKNMRGNFSQKLPFGMFRWN